MTGFFESVQERLLFIKKEEEVLWMDLKFRSLD